MNDNTDTPTEITPFSSPYHEAWDYIGRHDGGGSHRLAKLVLSLYNGYDYSFAVSECLVGLDSRLTRLALQLIAHYADRGETQALRDIGEKTKKRFPTLVKLGELIYLARNAQ